jgi:hypothetical protein
MLRSVGKCPHHQNPCPKHLARLEVLLPNILKHKMCYYPPSSTYTWPSSSVSPAVSSKRSVCAIITTLLHFISPRFLAAGDYVLFIVQLAWLLTFFNWETHFLSWRSILSRAWIVRDNVSSISYHHATTLRTCTSRLISSYLPAASSALLPPLLHLKRYLYS